VFPDFTRADVRHWWAGLYPFFLTSGVDGIWNDMNEPAVFNVDGHTMPTTNLHRADPDLGGPASHARYHNVYGELMAQATREGVLKGRPDLRPFVLTRANFIGGHRYAATWTGDNVASWQHLDFSIPMVLNLGLSGQPFSGPDIGGFVGKGDGPMFSRWMGFGALFPFARGHTGKGNIDKEPWAFDEDVEQTSRLALEGRYRLIPYLYTVFREASETGLPV
ncbi:MAG: alpha-glucosidase, partial [Proteobacteria bacterium]|nr:alpha-glucosidase [Pseudomonadota bacterium]